LDHQRLVNSWQQFFYLNKNGKITILQLNGRIFFQLSQLFIYIAPNRNRSYLKALFIYMYCMSCTLYNIDYRDPTNTTIGDSGEEKLPFNRQTTWTININCDLSLKQGQRLYFHIQPNTTLSEWVSSPYWHLH